MYSKKTNKGYIIRLVKNEQLIQELTKFCEQNNIRSGYFYGLGSALNAEYGYYHTDEKKYNFKKFDKVLEILSLTGNISVVDNKPFLHAHTVLSDENFLCFGGHLKELTVGPTCEIYLIDFEGEITRSLDEEVGLKLLDFNEK